MAPREGLEPSRCPRSVAWRSLQLSYRGVLNGIPIVTGSDPESPVSFSLATTPFYEAFVFWRSGKDSNLQRLAPHRLSKPAAYRLAHRCMWRRIKDLNLWSPCGLSGFRNRRNRPALPILRMVPQRGIEPPSRGSSIRRSTFLSYRGIWRRERGLEPSNTKRRHLLSRQAGYHYRISTFDYREYSYLSPSISSFSMHFQQP